MALKFDFTQNSLGATGKEIAASQVFNFSFVLKTTNPHPPLSRKSGRGYKEGGTKLKTNL